MKNSILKALVIFAVFFIGTWGMIAVDTICMGYTGYGGKLVLDVEKLSIFN